MVVCFLVLGLFLFVCLFCCLFASLFLVLVLGVVVVVCCCVCFSGVAGWGGVGGGGLFLGVVVVYLTGQ